MPWQNLLASINDYELSKIKPVRQPGPFDFLVGELERLGIRKSENIIGLLEGFDGDKRKLLLILKTQDMPEEEAEKIRLFLNPA